MKASAVGGRKLAGMVGTVDGGGGEDGFRFHGWQR